MAKQAINLGALQQLAAMLANPEFVKALNVVQTTPVNTTVSAQSDRILKRNAAIARGFARKGIKVTFDKATGRFDNVKPYKTWLADGWQVRKGEHGVRGFFHLSQCDKVTAPTKAEASAEAAKLIAALPTKAELHA